MGVCRHTLPFSKSEKFCVMEQMLIGILGSLLSNYVQSQFSRRDFEYTHNKTNIPAQVNEMKEAGLNPALAYGQISAPQGQSLGNYQADYAQSAKDLTSIPYIKEQTKNVQQNTKTSEAEQSYYEALAYKTRAEGNRISFDVSHQQEMFDLDKEFKTLTNIGQNLKNSFQFTENSIRRIEEKMRRFDWEHYSETKAAELSQIVADTGLKLALTRTENVLRDWRLREIKSNINHLIALKVQAIKNGQLIDATKTGILSDNYLKKTEALYMRWLTNDHSDWSAYDQRRRWTVYGNTISSAISNTVSFGAGMLTRGYKGGLYNPALNYGSGSTMSVSSNPFLQY